MECLEQGLQREAYSESIVKKDNANAVFGYVH